MACATIRFYEELNDFLPPRKRKQDVVISFKQSNSIKDVIESMGVPHTEVDLILVNQMPVNFSYIIRPQDRISVYPIFESFDISSLNRLRPQPLRHVRFVLDAHLGKLARYLRMLGFDTLYDSNCEDKELADLSSSSGKRILLTRDVGLLKRKQISHGYYVKSTQPGRQIREVLDRFDLRDLIRPFKLCVNCNGVLCPLEKTKARDHIPPDIYLKMDKFVACTACRQIYWQGSHYDKMMKFIDILVTGA
jgi:hypothetical protein